MCDRHDEDVGHGLWVLSLTRYRNPVRGDTGNIGAFQGTAPIGLGEPTIVANERRNSSQIGSEHWKAEIAGFEKEGLVIPQMNFAVSSDIAFWSDGHRSVIERTSLSLANACDNRNAK